MTILAGGQVYCLRTTFKASILLDALNDQIARLLESWLGIRIVIAANIASCVSVVLSR